MKPLDADERRALRAKAQRLHAVVSIGQHGLTPAVLHEIDLNLLAHELIKVRVFSSDRTERETLLARICEAMDAAPVQHIGKMLVLWRQAVKEPEVMRKTERGAPRRRPRNADPVATKVQAQPAGATRAPRSGAKRAPQARRPRSPTPRQPARPPRGRGTGAETTRRRGRG